MKRNILLCLLLITFVQAKVEPEKRHHAQMRLLTSYLASQHYQNTILDDEKSKEILDNYLKSLDFNKVLFIEDDINKFKRYEKSLDDFAHKGRLDIIYEMYNLSVEKRRQQINWMIKRLASPFREDFQGVIQLDREKIAWAKNAGELRQRWEKYLLNEWINLRLANKDNKKVFKILIKRYKNILKRIDKIKSDNIFQLYANAVTSSYDPHTAYFSPVTGQSFNINMSLSLEGIGAELTVEEDGLITIKKLIAGGPAIKSGKLSFNDKILGVAQGEKGTMKDIVGWDISEAVSLIRGKRGTKVRLQIRKSLNNEIVEILLTRDKIKLEEQAAKSKIKKIKKDGKTYRVGIIDLPSFYIDFDAANKGDKNYRSTTRDVKKLITKLVKDNIDCLLIDLRNNGGGSLLEVVSLVGLFIDKGPVVQVKRSGGNLQIYRDKDNKTFYKGPLAVLINENSASASEIFAGAIKDYGRGVILGEPTFGKGTVQSIINLGMFLPSIKDKIGRLKMTIAMFYRINGSSTQLKGVVPDLYIPNKESYVKGGESDEKHALAWRKIAGVKYNKFSLVTENIINKLRDNYKKRNAHDLQMKNLVDLLSWRKKLMAEKEISLSFKKRLQIKNAVRDKNLYFQNNFRKIYNYPLISANYLDKKEKDKSKKEKENDKKYEIDAVLDIASKTAMDYVNILKDN